MSKRKSVLWWLAALAVASSCNEPAPSVAPGRDPHAFRPERAAGTIVWNRAMDELPRSGARAAGTEFRGAAADASVFAVPKHTLVLYDRTGPYGVLGELYAIGVANLTSHFGTYVAKAATTYTCGELALYDAAIYVGSTYDEPLPTCLLDEVNATTKPVIWIAFNLWQLSNRAGFDPWVAKHGWIWTALDYATYNQVTYKGRTLARYGANGSGLLGTLIYDPSKSTVLATARSSATTATQTWAIRSSNLTYISEIPFTYMTEEDRYLIFADLLFDALDPTAVERHRCVVRLEDIAPTEDPERLRAIADYLSSQNVPFGFGVIAEYKDPSGFYNDNQAERYRLDQRPELVAALKYLQTKGGTMVMHGWTHQYDGAINPYTRVSGDDTEFYRMIENADHTINYAGPLPTDTIRMTQDRIANGRRNYTRAGLVAPTIFEFPHYAGSVNAYRAIATAFTARWERSLYFPGLLSGAAPSYQWMFGQLFPYSVRDVYGTKVLPENLGNIEPEPFHIYPVRRPADIINAAEKNLVVRDGVCGFYFHPFFDIEFLKLTVEGIRALGYTFVSPNDL